MGFHTHNSPAHCTNSVGLLFFDRPVVWASECDLGVNVHASAEVDLLKLTAFGDSRKVNLNWVNNTSYKMTSSSSSVR